MTNDDVITPAASGSPERLPSAPVLHSADLRRPPRAGDVEPGPSHQWTNAGAGHALDSVLMSDDLRPRLPKGQPKLLKLRDDSDL
jgi:hypothetical protein